MLDTLAPRRTTRWPLPAGERRGDFDAATTNAGGDESTIDAGRDESVVERVARHVDALGRLLEPARSLGGLDADQLRAHVATLRRLDGLATVALARATRAAHRSGITRADGASSATDWIKSATGMGGRDANRLARLGANFDDMPRTADAVARGDVPVESADAIVQAARDGRLGSPSEVERQLLDAARGSTPEAVRADIRHRQQHADGAALLRDERRQHARRRASLVRDGDSGMWDLHARLPDEVGSLVATAFDAFTQPDPPGTAPERRRSGPQRRADALADMTRSVLDHDLADGTGGIARPHLSAIVDADLLRADLTDEAAADPDAPDAAIAPDDPSWADFAPGELDWGGHLSPQAIRRLLCDAAVSRIVLAGTSMPLDIGRASRSWPEPQRRAINARDRRCRGPNCTRPIAWTAVHHIRWWRNNGVTAVDNGIALCHHCHALVHDHGWTVQLDICNGDVTWTSPDGIAHVDPLPPRPPPPARDGNDHAGPRTDPGIGTADGPRPGAVRNGPDHCHDAEHRRSP
ncbi:MAG TPA: HNH endonuclease [Nitriliruptoraceae bacterium]|nr:HNH endonuclease [Nitriliruptoraceae bacterium]